ncbi:MAG: 23S rRNA (adenine(2503)-C(2))-methyltransferase RlmN [Peptococcaceae bacterium]
MKKDLRSLNLEDMEQLTSVLKLPSFRAKQIFSWVHNKQVEELAHMNNLGRDILDRLGPRVEIANLRLSKERVARDGTVKYLFGLRDDQYIECVLMKYRGTESKKRNTLCISSQVGCAMGCGFCATGRGGLQRNLTTGEILSQVYTVNNILRQKGEGYKVGNVVFMGMGEPLHNFNNVLQSIGLLNHPKGQNISMRRIAVSTCGIVPKIIELAKKKLDIVLAISLHAPTDELRSQIMPVNGQYPLEMLKKACLLYIEMTNRRISFEYALINNFNDQRIHAVKLAEYLAGMLCHVNLIPVNPVNDDFSRPNKNKIQEFLKVLRDHGIQASIREEKGTDIEAACGQLRGKVVE